MSRVIVFVGFLGLLGGTWQLQVHAGDVHPQDVAEADSHYAIDSPGEIVNRHAAEAHAAATQARERHLAEKMGQTRSAGFSVLGMPTREGQPGTREPEVLDRVPSGRAPSLNDVGGTANEPSGSVFLTRNGLENCTYYTLRIHPGTNNEPGRYGAEVLLEGEGIRTLQGGLNFGGLATTFHRGFAAFSISNENQEDQMIYLGVSGERGTVRLERRSASGNTTYIDVVHESGRADYQAVVPNGFYVVNYTPDWGPEIFGISALTSYVERPGGGFQGGAVVGGYHNENYGYMTPLMGATSGWAGFCLDQDYEVNMQVFSTPTYPHGAQGMAFSVAEHPYNFVLESLDREDEHGDSCSTATPLDLTGTSQYLSATATVTIEFPLDQDFFEVYLPDDATLVASTPYDGRVQSVGMLYDADCTVIVEDNRSRTAWNFEIERDLVQGTYYISVLNGYSSASIIATELMIDVAIDGG